MSWQICCAVFRTGTWSSEKTASLWTRQTHWPSWLPISLPSPTSDSWESRALPEVWPQALPLTGTTNLHTSLTSQTHSVVFWVFLGGGRGGGVLPSLVTPPQLPSTNSCCSLISGDSRHSYTKTHPLWIRLRDHICTTPTYTFTHCL